MLLAGCKTDSRLSPDARFEAGGSDAQGLVVLGMRVARETQGHNFVFGDDYNLNPIYSVDIVAVGPNGKVARRGARRVQLCDADRLILRGAFSDCTPQVMEYRVVAVPPGRYVLGDFSARISRAALAATSFIKPDPSPLGLFTDLATPGDPVAHPERSFPVEAGEIVYIGDLIFDAHHFPVRLMLGRDDRAAQSALDLYPNVTGKVTFRPIFGTYP